MSAFGDRHVIVACRVTAYNFLFIDVITDDIIILFMYLCYVLHFVSAILAIIVTQSEKMYLLAQSNFKKLLVFE